MWPCAFCSITQLRTPNPLGGGPHGAPPGAPPWGPGSLSPGSLKPMGPPGSPWVPSAPWAQSEPCMCPMGPAEFCPAGLSPRGAWSYVPRNILNEIFVFMYVIVVLVPATSSKNNGNQ